MNIRHLISRRIEAITARLAELANMDLGSDITRRTTRQVELDCERRNLQQELRIATKKVEVPDYDKLSQVNAQARMAVELEIKERTKYATAFADKLEREGDH